MNSSLKLNSHATHLRADGARFVVVDDVQRQKAALLQTLKNDNRQIAQTRRKGDREREQPALLTAETSPMVGQSLNRQSKRRECERERERETNYKSKCSFGHAQALSLLNGVTKRASASSRKQLRPPFSRHCARHRFDDFDHKESKAKRFKTVFVYGEGSVTVVMLSMASLS
jgi:hypothetical protein